ncbi:hypothetical protein RUM44_002029 [Polyplax serrata]|uniref:Uncharacterized protein n=1 Tax=Polyplax serrata TaxID=468196 RepID=A0ABR1AME7_POLSC
MVSLENDLYGESLKCDVLLGLPENRGHVTKEKHARREQTHVSLPPVKTAANARRTKPNFIENVQQDMPARDANIPQSFAQKDPVKMAFASHSRRAATDAFTRTKYIYSENRFTNSL